MNNGLTGSESGLMVNYNFNQGTADGNNTSISLVADNSINGIDATINNMALTGTSSNFVTGVITNNSLSAETQSVCKNDLLSAMTSSLAGGSGLTYQWYSNSTASNTGGTLISNETSSSYSPPSNSYIVEVTATDGNGNFSRQLMTVFISPFCGNWGN